VIRDALPDPTEEPLMTAARALQAVLAAVVVYALVTVQVGLVFNGLMPLLVALIPDAVRRRYGHQMHPGLVLWITVAAALHGVGALGPYREFGWYDQVAHSVSAALVAGVGYALVRAIDRHHEGVVVPSRLRFVFVLVFVVSFGVLWEIAEFASGGLASLLGGDAVLAQYGIDDIALDLLFNAVGGVLVALWGTGYFDGVAALLGWQVDWD